MISILFKAFWIGMFAGCFYAFEILCEHLVYGYNEEEDDEDI